MTLALTSLANVSLSTLLTLLVDCTTKRGNWKSGGQTQRAWVSTLSNVVSLINIQVRVKLSLIGAMCLHSIEPEYTIDDGHGGKIHVNVSE